MTGIAIIAAAVWIYLQITRSLLIVLMALETVFSWNMSWRDRVLEIASIVGYHLSKYAVDSGL